MSQLLIERKQRYQRYRPYGWQLALVTGSIVTLIGVYQNVDPWTILTRATISALLIGILVSIGLVIVRTANIQKEN